jgi:hypothetical protein
MLRICKNNKDEILKSISEGRIDAAENCFGNLVDDIILKMKKAGLTRLLNDALEDKRATKNSQIPMEFLLLLSIAAKMKVKTALTDIPYAINDAQTLAELGWNLYDSDRSLENGLLSEGAVRNFIDTYREEGGDPKSVYSNVFTESYNDYARSVKATLDLEPFIHMLDCTMMEVSLRNENYEKAEVTKDDDGAHRGYKLGTLRGLHGNSGIIEEVAMSSIKTHDLKACEEMVRRSEHLKEGDILINDRGFLSRELLNHLKTARKVDVYVPARSGMAIYEEAVKIAKMQGKWQKHPNQKRKKQKIAFVGHLGNMWQSASPDEDVEVNVCVVHDEAAKKKEKEYFVFMTTDVAATARQIIKTYELRPEIEEDYRQLKDFWQLEDFRSRKYLDITFHVVMLLIGYLYFQLYKEMEEGEKYANKSLPVILKNHAPKKRAGIVIYSGDYFAVFGFHEIMQLYLTLGADVRKHLDKFFVQL